MSSLREHRNTFSAATAILAFSSGVCPRFASTGTPSPRLRQFLPSPAEKVARYRATDEEDTHSTAQAGSPHPPQAVPLLRWRRQSQPPRAQSACFLLHNAALSRATIVSRQLVGGDVLDTPHSQSPPPFSFYNPHRGLATASPRLLFYLQSALFCILFVAFAQKQTRNFYIQCEKYPNFLLQKCSFFVIMKL
jgi:hypothetical protein